MVLPTGLGFWGAHFPDWRTGNQAALAASQAAARQMATNTLNASLLLRSRKGPLQEVPLFCQGNRACQVQGRKRTELSLQRRPQGTCSHVLAAPAGPGSKASDRNQSENGTGNSTPAPPPQSRTGATRPRALLTKEKPCVPELKMSYLQSTFTRVTHSLNGPASDTDCGVTGVPTGEWLGEGAVCRTPAQAHSPGGGRAAVKWAGRCRPETLGNHYTRCPPSDVSVHHCAAALRYGGGRGLDLGWWAHNATSR